MTSPRRSRQLTFENLQKRELLAADLGGALAITPDAGLEAPAAPVVRATAQDPIVIQSVTLEINGMTRTVFDDLSIVEVRSSDHLEVVGVNYEVHSSLAGHAGVLALEGYLNRLFGDGQSTTDYQDGRFSTRASNPTVAEGMGSHEGLASGWDLDAGGNRLSISLVMYDSGGATIVDQHYVKLQVGKPDFEVDEEVVQDLLDAQIRKGEEFHINGAWTNHGDGRFHNYAEVDVYHASNLNEPEWVGVLAGVTGPNESVEGEFSNPSGQFSQTWTPAHSGGYVFKFYADPENLWDETNESNNLHTLNVNVLPELPPGTQTVDGGDIKVKNVNVRAGEFDDLKIDVKLYDQEGTEQYKVVLRDLPSFFKLSAGTRLGDDWVLEVRDLDDLEILADTQVKKMEKYEFVAALVATEPLTGESTETTDSFKVHVKKSK